LNNDLAKNFAAEIALKADVRETLRVLVPAIESAGGPSLAKLASDRIESLKQRNWSTNHHRLEREILQKNGAIPIDPDWIALQVISSLPPNAILVDEGLTSSRYMSALPMAGDPKSILRLRQLEKSSGMRSLDALADIADRRRSEVALVHFGAHVDVMGLRLEEITPSLIDDTLALYPRIGMKAAFTEALAEVARKKPHTAIGTGLGDIGRRLVHGLEIPNVCDIIHAAPFES
jgi:hypothetical protein